MKQKEFNFREELRKIVPYAELDEVRWISLIKQVDEKFDEFIKRLKNKQCLIKDGTEHCDTCLTCQEIDKLAGRDLISEGKE